MTVTLTLVCVIFGLDVLLVEQYWAVAAYFVVPVLLINVKPRSSVWAIILIACTATLIAPYVHDTDTVPMQNLPTRAAIGIIVIAIAMIFEVLQDRTSKTPLAQLGAHQSGDVFSPEALKTILDNIVEAIVIIDDRGQIAFFTPAAERLFGFKERDVRGRDINMLMPENVGREHANYLHRYQNSHEGHIIGKGFREVTGRRHDGKEILIEMAINDVMIGDKQYFIGTLRDIGVRKKAENELRESESQFRHLAENIEDVFWVREKGETQPSYISPAFERIWGIDRCSENAPDSVDLNSLIHPKDMDRVLLEKARSDTEGYDIEYMIVRPDGDIRNIRERCFPVRDESGQTIRNVGVACDITEETSMRAYMTQMAKLAGLGRMLSGTSHELSQPLHVIRMAAEGAREVLLSGDNDSIGYVTNKLDRIVGQTERIAAIVEKFRKLGNPQSNESQPTELRAVMDSAFSIVTERAERSSIDLNMEYPAHCSKVQGDGEELKQAISNILVNACDAIEASISASSMGSQDHKISMSVVEDIDSKHVVVRIENTGGKIPDSHIDKIFDPFFTTREVGMGMGLGLSVSHAIVNETGGRIEVENGSRGAIFSIYLATTGDAQTFDLMADREDLIELAPIM